jgi:methylthioribose-1-phosphate isomerase
MGTPLKMTTSLRTTTHSGVTQIEIIDQLLLPHTTSWIPIRTPSEAHAAIKRMQIRGAPAIASLAALSFAAQLEAALAGSDTEQAAFLQSQEALSKYVTETLDYLNTARPTAVNLSQAMRRLRRVLDDGASAGQDVTSIVKNLIETGHAVADEDVGRNRAMAAHGAEWLLQRVERLEGKRRKLRVLTVCNTGSLATSVSSFALSLCRALLRKSIGIRHSTRRNYPPIRNRHSRAGVLHPIYTLSPGDTVSYI